MAMALKQREESTSAETVTVACSIDIGATLHLEEMFEVSEAVMGAGSRLVKQYRKVGEPVYLKGPGRNRNGSADPDSPISDGYALTFGVSKEFMDLWWKQAVDAKWHPVMNGMIRYGARGDIKSMTKENANQRTGLEPMDPKGDKRGRAVKAYSRDA